MMSRTNERQNLLEGTASSSGDEQGRSTWAAALVGMALFLITGLELILGEIPHHWAVSAWLRGLGGVWFLGFFILPVLSLGIGWVKSFPRWSYPYVGFVLLISRYMMHVATPGLRVFGYTFGRNDLWGWRAWIPFSVMAIAALLITRSPRPVFKFFTQAWEDWTLLTFAMFGFMPLLIAIGFDEVDRLYSLPFMVALTLVMVGIALAYLRSTSPWHRVLALLVGIILTVAVATVAPTAYWLEHGWVNVKWTFMIGALVVAVIFSPLLLGLLCRFIQFLQGVGGVSDAMIDRSLERPPTKGLAQNGGGE
jgi:hypothetical protein